MIFLVTLIITISYWESRLLIKKGLYKEIVVHLVISFISLTFGIYYILNPTGKSFARIILNILK